MGTAIVLQSNEIVHLQVEKIAQNPYQPRKFFDRAALEDLSSSIKQYGVMQPITVRYINGTSYELVAGERRLRASKLAGMETIPAVIVDITDQDSAVLALIENLQRQNLHFIEEAEGFQNLISDYNFTQDALAQKIGKSQSTIANKLRILRLSKKVKDEILANDLTERHARALLKLESDHWQTEEVQLQVVAKVVKNNLNVKKTEELVEATIERLTEKPEKTKSNIKSYIKDIRLFTNTIKQAVDLMNNAGVVTQYEMEESAEGCFISILVNYGE